MYSSFGLQYTIRWNVCAKMNYLFNPVIWNFHVDTQLQVIYSNRMVAEIFFTFRTRGLGLYYSRRIIYQDLKLQTSRAAHIATLSPALWNRRYYPSIIAPKRFYPILRVKVYEREKDNVMHSGIIAPFISSVKGHSSEQPACPCPDSKAVEWSK